MVAAAMAVVVADGAAVKAATDRAVGGVQLRMRRRALLLRQARRILPRAAAITRAKADGADIAETVVGRAADSRAAAIPTAPITREDAADRARDQSRD